ncbi:hypothetical protein CDAR_116131 [Caerostris darwini]|uniref:Uncharacterized protein n=1 Tax=Caerostris darwini TaxID=1538125 RepID=A0AAV4SPN1_9ARAC|nr:hypothetical protein CDAR_116131 [Caerostris darwini]
MAPGIDLKRVNILTTHLKSETLAMIAERYPSEEWIYVYMDGSQKSEACSSGFFFSVAQGSIAVSKSATNFDSVVAAISEAARVMLPLPSTKKVVFLPNSISAICWPYVHLQFKKD